MTDLRVAPQEEGMFWTLAPGNVIKFLVECTDAEDGI